MHLTRLDEGLHQRLAGLIAFGLCLSGLRYDACEAATGQLSALAPQFRFMPVGIIRQPGS